MRVAELNMRETPPRPSHRSIRFAVWCACSLAVACHREQPAAPKPTPATAAQTEASKYGLTTEQAASLLVQVGDKRITLGDFAERLGNQSPYLRARYHSPERRREFLDNMVRFELLATEADKRGFTKSEDVERVRKQAMVQQMMQDLFDKGGIKLGDVSEAEIKAYYDQNTSEFDKPAQVRASHILFKDKASAEKVLKELRLAPTDMELFRKLASANNSDATTKDSFGDLRFFSETPDKSGETDEPKRPQAVRTAAFTLAKVGDLYGQVVQSEQGFHIVKLTGKREALKRSLEDARRMIQNKLWRLKREQAIDRFVADLRTSANVQENPEVLAQVQVKDGSGKAGDMAGTHDKKTDNAKAQAPSPAGAETK
jgi:peptidyl-prolyl cis-trans isomerase C